MLRYFTSCLTVFLGACALCCGFDRNDIKGFFDSGPDRAETFSADKLYPQGRLFPFSFYSVGGGSENRREELLPESERRADQKYIAEAGVTMIGPQYELNDFVVDDAVRLGTKAFYSVWPTVNGEKVTKELLKKLTEEGVDYQGEVKKSAAEIVRSVADNPEIAWWDLKTEELRYWVKPEFDYLQLVSDTIRNTDPQKRPVFMYEPNARTASALTKNAPYLDIVGKGMYINFSHMKDSRVWCRWTIEQEIEAIKNAGRDGAIPICLPEMFQSPAPDEIKLIPTWVRHDVYLAMVTGAKGVVVFSASKRPDFAEARKLYLDSYLVVCSQLTGSDGKSGFGQVFLFGTPKNDLEFAILDGPEQVQLKIKDKTIDYPSVAMSNISYKNSRYVFLVNSSSESIEAVVSGLAYGSNITLQNLFDDKIKFTAPEGDFMLELAPLEVKAYRIYAAE